MNYMILLAGGIGSRVGAEVPKQFIEVLGKPVIAYTLQRFQDHPQIDGICLVCVKGFEENLRRICEENGITKVVKVVEGGEDYQHSVMNGIRGMEGIAAEDDVVMIHWAASPFVSEEIISDNIRVCREKGNAMSCCPAYLLYGTNDGDCSKQVVDRDTFRTLSAPQSFLFANAKRIYREGLEKGIIDRIEPHTTTLMAELGEPIYFSYGDQSNIKITTKEDVDMFLGYELARRWRAEHNK